MDANKTAGEETRWQLHKNAACNPQQVLAATPHKTPTVRPPAPFTKTIQVRRTRHAGHCWRSRDELIRDVLLWIPTHGRAKAGRPARTYIQQLCEDTGCCPEDLPRAMNDREEWRERVRDIRAASTIWWWWACKYALRLFTKHRLRYCWFYSECVCACVYIFSSYNVWYPVLTSRQPGVITVSVAQGDTATSGTTKQLLPPDRVLKELYIYIYYTRSIKSRDYIGRYFSFLVCSLWLKKTKNAFTFGR